MNKFDVHILNDSLQLYCKAPHYFFETDKRKLVDRIKKEEGCYGHIIKCLNNIILFAIASDSYTSEPYYEYYVTIQKLSSDKSQVSLKEDCKNVVIRDTIINDFKLQCVIRSYSRAPCKIKKWNPFLSSIRIGEGYNKNLGSVMDLLELYSGSNRYLNAYEDIKNYPSYSVREDWLKLQMQLTYASFFQNHPDYKTLLSKFGQAPKATDSLIVIIQNNMLKDTSSYNAILKDAATTKVVMINENHFVPEHRLLTLKLLKSLKALGYHYLALEGLDKGQDSLLNTALPYPTLETGFYTREATFGNLIRNARELGYTLVAYENFVDSVEREVGQATKLFNKTFLKDPNAKVIVHAGISHILEKPTESNKKWMAAIFKEKYGIDPLTIDQTQLNRYRKFFDKNLVIIPSKAFKDNYRLNSVDYLVLNNLSLMDDDENDHEIKYKNEFEKPVQLNVFLRNELEFEKDYNNKVPIKVYYLGAGQGITINLPEKEVSLVVYGKEGKVLDRQVFPQQQY